jgi:hypothetical protein
MANVVKMDELSDPEAVSSFRGLAEMARPECLMQSVHQFRREQDPLAFGIRGWQCAFRKKSCCDWFVFAPVVIGSLPLVEGQIGQTDISFWKRVRNRSLNREAGGTNHTFIPKWCQ